MLKGFAGGKVFGDHYEGGDSLVVFLHGWARTKEDFGGVVSALRTINDPPTVLNLDLPGFGVSPSPDAPCGTDWYGEIVTQVVREYSSAMANVRSVYLVGHSFGGRVAMQIAGRGWLESLDTVLLSGVPLLRLTDASPPPLSYRIVRSLVNKGLAPASILEAARRRRGSVDYLNATGVMRDVFVRSVNEDYGELLRGYDGELILLWGELDATVPVEVAKRINDQFLGRATLEVVPDAGHLLPVERPKTFADAVGAMVESTRS